MSIEHTSVIAQRVEEVFAWHTRPGAMSRLIPPWQPMRAVQETPSLANGSAVLGLPGGLRWVARHVPDEFDPPHRFTDELASEGPRSWPARVAGHWRHVHEFSDRGDDTTLMRDHVETLVPAAVLRPMFVYRHRQLADDLAPHRDAGQLLDGPQTVAITGGSGLVGTELRAFLRTGGHRVISLVRHRAGGPDERHWDPDHPATDLLDGVDAVVHLAGASIAGRFTAAHKTAIRDSRIEPTARLAEVAAGAAGATGGPRVFITASAIGFYGFDRGDEELSEDSDRGAGFLADVVADWEAAGASAAAAGLRVVQVRTGIVQSARGGTLRLLRPLFSAGLGGRLGSGRQWVSWIGIDDLLDIYYRAIFDARLAGPVNAVGPRPVRNTEYTAALAKVLHRPAWVPVPAFGPRLLLGSQGVRELAEANQRVLPSKLQELGHRFRQPRVEDALAHQLGHG